MDDEQITKQKPNTLEMLKQMIAAKILRSREVGAEEMSKRMPAAVMPREAVERKRAQYKQWEDQTRDE